MVKIYKICIALVIFIVLTGCSTLETLAPDLVKASFDMQKEKYKDIEIAMNKDFDRDILKKFKSVAFLVETGKQDFFSPGIASLFSDNLTKEFIKIGFGVADRESLEKVIDEIKFQRSDFARHKNVAKIGKMIGVKGIFKCNIQTIQESNNKKMGMEIGIEQGIKGASLKLIDIETTKVVLIITATYKKPKDASVVAKHIAESFKLYSEKEDLG